MTSGAVPIFSHGYENHSCEGAVRLYRPSRLSSFASSPSATIAFSVADISSRCRVPGVESLRGLYRSVMPLRLSGPERSISMTCQKSCGGSAASMFIFQRLRSSSRASRKVLSSASVPYRLLSEATNAFHSSRPMFGLHTSPDAGSKCVQNCTGSGCSSLGFGAARAVQRYFACVAIMFLMSSTYFGSQAIASLCASLPSRCPAIWMPKLVVMPLRSPSSSCLRLWCASTSPSPLERAWAIIVSSTDMPFTFWNSSSASTTCVRSLMGTRDERSSTSNHSFSTKVCMAKLITFIGMSDSLNLTTV